MRTVTKRIAFWNLDEARQAENQLHCPEKGIHSKLEEPQNYPNGRGGVDTQYTLVLVLNLDMEEAA